MLVHRHINLYDNSTMFENSRAKNNYQLIVQTIRQIPKGKVATYGEIAKLCDLNGQARLVGYALNSLPPKSRVPWHRVINAQGKISFPKSSAHHRRQKNLLKREGVVFQNERIDLEKYDWLVFLNEKCR